MKMKIQPIRELKEEMKAVARGERKAPVDAAKDSIEGKSCELGFNVIGHVTPVGGNVFADLGFEQKEADRLLAETDRIISEKLAKR